MGAHENFDFDTFMKGVREDETLDKAIEPEGGYPEMAKTQALIEKVKVALMSPAPENIGDLRDALDGEIKRLSDLQNAVPRILSDMEAQDIALDIVRLRDVRDRIEGKIH